MKNSAVILEYLSKTRMTIRDFSRQCGITHSTVYNVIKRSIIRKDTARKIEAGTYGKIKITDFDIYVTGTPKEKKPLQ